MAGRPFEPGARTRQALRETRDRVLLRDLDGRSRTGAELEQATAAVAGALAARGLTGRRVGLAYRNSLAAYEAFLAVEWIGATRVAVDADVPADEARAILDAAAVDAVLADEEHAAGLGDALIHDVDAPLPGTPWTEELTVDPEDPMLVYPRSVAGGELFAVTSSFANWNAIMRVNCDLFASRWYGPGLGDNECLLTMQQLMHGTGMVASFPFLLLGLPQVVMSRFDGERAVRAILEHRATATFGVPGMLTRMADALGEGGPVLPLRHTLYGGAPLPVAELRRVRRVLGPSLVQLYGRFEAGWPLSVLDQDDHTQILNGDDDLATSCGRFIPQVETRFGPAPGHPPGHGELQTRNGMVSAQYADPEGWCSLGDVAYLDARGYLHLAGRLDGMINTGSYHVYPQQVEEAIQRVAGVAEVEVTGEEHPVWGQAVTAYIVPDAERDFDALVEQIKTELPQYLARYKIPKSFRRVDTLPTP